MTGDSRSMIRSRTLQARRWRGPATLVFAAALAGCASTAPKQEAKPMPRGWTELETQTAAADMVFAAQPDPAGLVAYRDAGGTVVVNFRTEGEMTGSVGYDEAALAESLGLEYVHIPISSREFGTAELEQFAEVYRAHKASGSTTPLLTHCGSGGRCKVMYAGYLIVEEGLSADEAIARAVELGAKPEWSSIERLREVTGQPAADAG